MLAKGFFACPEQSAKVTFYKILRNSQDASPWVFRDSCLPILHNKGRSEPSLGINTWEMGDFEGE